MKDGIPGLEAELQRFVSSEVARQRVNVALDAPLVESGLVDSLGLLQIVAHVERRYGVRLTESGGPGDFRSIASLADAVRRGTGSQGAS